VPTVLVVDDVPENLTVLGELLVPYYTVRAANSGPAALRRAATHPRPDLILLDLMMPGMDGYEVLQRLRGDAPTRDIPVICVTALDATEEEERGLSMGAVDYITKPLRPSVVLARVRTHIELKRARDWLSNQNAVLEAEVARRMRENQLAQDASIHALARLATSRGTHLDPDVVDVFLGDFDTFRAIAERHADTAEDIAAKEASLRTFVPAAVAPSTGS